MLQCYQLHYTVEELNLSVFLIHIVVYFQAFEKVRNLFPVTGGHLELITENRYGDAMYIMENHFLEGQPLCGAFGVKWSKSFERLSLTALKDNLSVMSVSNKTSEVMGILINSVLKQTDSNDSVDIEDESLKALYEFLAH